MNRTLYVLAMGVAWAVIYNAFWGVAWFTFMRREWTEAMASKGQEIPWTLEVWILWITLTIPIGIAVMAYVESRRGDASPVQTGLVAGLVLGALMTLGMAAWIGQETLPTRIILLDPLVNLAAMIAASLGGGWLIQRSSSATFRG